MCVVRVLFNAVFRVEWKARIGHLSIAKCCRGEVFYECMRKMSYSSFTVMTFTVMNVNKGYCQFYFTHTHTLPH